MTVRARDQQTPEKTATAQVVINVRRNTQSPRFVSVPYDHTMSENTIVSSSVFTVSALDDDLQVGTIKMDWFHLDGYYYVLHQGELLKYSMAHIRSYRRETEVDTDGPGTIPYSFSTQPFVSLTCLV